MTNLILIKSNKTEKTHDPMASGSPGPLDDAFPGLKDTRKDTRIITVSSNKGGVGKTSIAITAGLYFSNVKNEPTLLLELDSSPGDFSSLFDIDHGKTLEMAVRFPENFHKYIKKIGKNLDAIGGIINPVVAEGVGREDFYSLLIKLGGEYKNIIVDTQTVLNGMIIDAYLSSETIMLVTDYSLESMCRILALYNILTGKLAIPEDKIDLIINKKQVFDFLKLWDYSKIAGIPVSGFISFDKKFSKSFFLTNHKRVFKTRFYRQLKRLIEDESKKQVS